MKRDSLIIDNTFLQPLIYAGQLNMELILSSIQQRNGCWNGTTLGGIIVDGGNLIGTVRSFPASPDPSYHNLFMQALPEAAFIVKARVQLLRDLGRQSALLMLFNLILALKPFM